jgi:Copper amine oxidase N-terminal domain.
MKKLISLALTLALALSLSVPALAAQTTAGAKTAGAASQTVGVVLDGKSVAFPDAQPVLKSGRTMVPYRALVESLGGTVAYQDGTITCQVNGAELSFQAGGTAVTVKDASGTRTVQMDAACYVVNGRTYVPVRFFAQALGYDVLWDSAKRSAVLVDSKTLIAEADKNFTQLNAALKKVASDPSKNYKSSAVYDIGLNLKDESGKAVTAALKLNLTMISSATAVEMKGTADASSLADMMGLDAAVKAGTMTSAQVTALRSTLSNVSFQVICSLTDDAMYVNLPALSALTGASASAWYKLSLGLDSLGLSAGSQSTVGTLIYAACRSSASEDSTLAAGLYDTVRETSTALTAFLGDGKSVQSGTSSKWTMDSAALTKILGADAASLPFKTFNVTLTANADGSMDIAFNIALSTAGEAGLDMTASGTMNVTASSGKINMKLDMGTLGSATYALTIAMTPTSETPATQPPAGAVVVDLGDMSSLSALAPQTAA